MSTSRDFSAEYQKAPEDTDKLDLTKIRTALQSMVNMKGKLQNRRKTVVLVVEKGVVFKTHYKFS